MRKYLPHLLWIGLILIILQVCYFFTFTSKPIRHDEGIPLTVNEISLPARNVVAMVSDGDDLVWIGTDGQGLFRYQPSTQKSETFTTANLRR